jgi:hypothetical protein
MNLRMTTLAFVMAVLGAAPLLRAELQVDAQKSDDGELTVFKMTVTPAAAPVPALRQRLILREIDEKQGNAAPFYYRAIMMSPDVTKALRDNGCEDYEKWFDEEASAELPMDKVRKAAEIIANSSVMGQLREAALRRECNWGWDLESVRGPELFSFLLPEVQQTRTLSRLLILRARLEIRDRRFDQAVDDLRMNLKMGRDLATEPLLICGLVGVAEANAGNQAMIDFMAAPNSPNLYWALTELPAPFIDLRRATRFEMSSVSRIFPFLKDAETQEHSPDEWARLLASGFTSMEPLTGANFGMMNEPVARMAVAGMSLLTYGPAKQRLIESGLDPARVEQMPVGQVVAIDAAREFRRLADELEKWTYQPYGVARDRAGEVEKMLGGNKLEGGYGRVMAALLLPALQSARAAEMRLQWQTNALRTVEAIRMHAAEAGKLPASLDEIKVVPVPENPATGESYQYRLDGNTGVIELPFSDGFRGVAWRFEIKLAN